MIGLLVEFHIKPGEENTARFLEWKRREGELQVHAPGFIKRSMAQDADNPDVYYYLTYWLSEDHMHHFSATPEFAAAQAETRVREAVAHRKMSKITEVFEDHGLRPEG